MNATRLLGATLLALAASGCLTETMETGEAALVNFDPGNYVCEDLASETRLVADCEASCSLERDLCLQGTGAVYRRYVARSEAAHAAVDWSLVDDRIAERAAQYDLVSCTEHFGYALQGAQKLVEAGAVVAPSIVVALGAFDTAFCGVYETLAVIGDSIVVIGTEIVETVVMVWYDIQEPFQRLYRWLEEQGCENQFYGCTEMSWWDSDNDGMTDMTGCPGYAAELHARCNPTSPAPAPAPYGGYESP
jgi:hypothetical protein